MMNNGPIPQSKLVTWRKHLMIVSLFLLGCVVLSHMYFEPIAGLVFLAFMISLIGFLALAWTEFQRKAFAIQEQENQMHAHAQGRPASVGVSASRSSTQSPSLVLSSDDLRNSASHVRVFASMEDGTNHGWTFEEPIGSFNGQPLYNIARYLGEAKQFVFDGLTMSSFPNIVSDAYVAFGRVRYKLLVPEVQESGSAHLPSMG